MVAFDQESRAVVKRPSLRDSGTIPVQCHVALRGTGGIFASPSGREGGPADQKQDNTRPWLPSQYVPDFKIRHVAMDLPRHPGQLSCYFFLHAISSVYYLQLI